MGKQSIIERTITQGQILESDKKKLPEGVLCRVTYPICNIGELNRNKRVYGPEVWEAVAKDADIQEKLKARCLFGHAEHPKDTSQSSTEKISHVVTKVYTAEGTKTVKCDIDVLDTPYGRICDTLLRAGCGLGTSTRAEGELEEVLEEGKETYYRVVPETYSLKTVDFTADPSTFGAYPESVERDLVGIVKAGVDDSKIDRQYAQVVLESLKVKEAKTLLESLKVDKRHKVCKCKTSEKKCASGCSHANEELEHRTEKDVPLEKDEWLAIEYPSSGATYHEKKWGVYKYGIYPEGSVLAGQERRVFIDMFDTEEEAVKAFPSAEVSKGSLYEPPNLSHLPDADETKKPVDTETQKKIDLYNKLSTEYQEHKYKADSLAKQINDLGKEIPMEEKVAIKEFDATTGGPAGIPLDAANPAAGADRTKAAEDKTKAEQAKAMGAAPDKEDKYKAEFEKLSMDYSYGKIAFEEFIAKVTELNKVRGVAEGLEGHVGTRDEKDLITAKSRLKSMEGTKTMAGEKEKLEKEIAELEAKVKESIEMSTEDIFRENLKIHKGDRRKAAEATFDMLTMGMSAALETDAYKKAIDKVEQAFAGVTESLVGEFSESKKSILIPKALRGSMLQESRKRIKKLKESKRQVSTTVDFDMGGKTYSAKVLIDIIHDATYGADADGHRGVAQDFVDEVNIEYVEDENGNDIPLPNVTKEMQDKIDAAVDAIPADELQSTDESKKPKEAKVMGKESIKETLDFDMVYKEMQKVSGEYLLGDEDKKELSESKTVLELNKNMMKIISKARKNEAIAKAEKDKAVELLEATVKEATESAAKVKEAGEKDKEQRVAEKKEFGEKLLKETKAIYEKKMDEMLKLHEAKIKELQEAHERVLFVKTVVEAKIKASGLELPANTVEMLKQCKNETEVDAMLSKFRYALKESITHGGKPEEMGLSIGEGDAGSNDMLSQTARMIKGIR